MDIGKNIRRLRREQDMTQEKLSELLNVTVSAGSQWESGKTSPDLALIPPMCSLFSVTADELLGLDLSRKNERINEVIEEGNKYFRRGYNEEARTILEAGLREFPGDHSLMSSLMYVAHDQARMAETPESSSDYREEAIRLAEDILENSRDDIIRHGAIQTLCLCLEEKGERQRAAKLAKTMPSIWATGEFLLSHVLDGDEGFHAVQRNMESMFDAFSLSLVCMNRRLSSGSLAYTDDEQAELRNKQLALFRLIFEDGKYGFFHTRLCDTCTRQAMYYAEKSNAEQVLDYLEQAAYHAIEFLNHCDDGYSCLMLRGYEVSGTFSTNSVKNDAARLLVYMDNSAFDFVREHHRFQAIKTSISPHAGDWKVD